MDNGNTPEPKWSEAVKLQIKQEFVEGYVRADGVREYPSLDVLAKRHGVGRATVYRHASREGWQNEKNVFQTELEREARDVRLRAAIEESGKLDHNALQLAHSLMGKVARALNRDEQRARNDPDYNGLTPVSLERFSIVLGNAQRVGKLALGEAQEISKVHADVTAPDSFRTVMEQLDELREHRAEEGNFTIQ